MSSKKRKTSETSTETNQNINDLRIDSADAHKELNEEEKEFDSLLQTLNKKLKQAEFDLLHGDYVVKEHCNEIRRQVQSAKETTLLKIEEITDKLFKKIDSFESDSLDAILKIEKEKFTSKLNELKIENEKWNKRIDDFKIIDSDLIDEIRDGISKLAIERENINFLLFKSKLLEFIPINIENVNIGSLSTVTVDSFDYKIDISRHIHELEQSVNFYYTDEFNEYIQVTPLFICNYSTIFSNGDLLLSGVLSDSAHSDKFNCAVILLFDLGRNELKMVKKNSFVKIDQIESCSDKVCIAFQNKNVFVEDPDEDFDLKSDDIGNDLPGENKDYESIKYIVFNQSLEEIHRIKCNQLITSNLIGASESSLVFIKDPKAIKEYENCLFFIYNWSLQFLRAIGKAKDIERPYACTTMYFGYFYNKIYCIYQEDIHLEDYQLKIFNDNTAKIIKTLQLKDKVNYSNFSFDCNNNMVLFNSGEDNLIEIKYFNYNGDLLLKVKSQKWNSNYLFHKNNNRNITYFDKDGRYVFYQKKLDESNYLVKSGF